VKTTKTANLANLTEKDRELIAWRLTRLSLRAFMPFLDALPHDLVVRALTPPPEAEARLSPKDRERLAALRALVGA